MSTVAYKDTEMIMDEVIAVFKQHLPEELKAMQVRKAAKDTELFGHEIDLDNIKADQYYFGLAEQPTDYPALMVDCSLVDYPGKQYGAANKYEDHQIMVVCVVADDDREQTARKHFRMSKCLSNVLIKNHRLNNLANGGYVQSISFTPSEDENGRLLKAITISLVSNIVGTTD